MKLHPTLAAWLARLGQELHCYRVEFSANDGPWAVYRDPPASEPGYEGVGSYAQRLDDAFNPVAYPHGGVWTTGPHGGECSLLLDLSRQEWENDRDDEAGK